jgi:hypothetical protein
MRFLSRSKPGGTGAGESTLPAEARTRLTTTSCGLLHSYYGVVDAWLAKATKKKTWSSDLATRAPVRGGRYRCLLPASWAAAARRLPPGGWLSGCPTGGGGGRSDDEQRAAAGRCCAHQPLLCCWWLVEGKKHDSFLSYAARLKVAFLATIAVVFCSPRKEQSDLDTLSQGQEGLYTQVYFRLKKS